MKLFTTTPYGLLVVSAIVLRIHSAQIPYTTWLTKFHDTLLVNLPVIPGSHDSGAIALGPNPSWQGESAWGYAQTQNLTILDQLNLGVRFLDIRLHVIYDEVDLSNTIVISHTYDTELTFSSCLSQIKSFLDLHPTEFVMLYLRIDSEHDLTGDVNAKQSYIQQTMIDSGITFGHYNGDALSTLMVKDVAGTVVILTPDGDTLPNPSQLDFIDSTVHYNVCSIFTNSTVAQAQSTMQNCFPIVPVSGEISLVITGYALDGQLNGLPPSTTSIQMNDWFFSNFGSNPAWIQRKKYPVQVVLIDFVNVTYMDYLLEYATGISPSSLVTGNSGDVNVSGKSSDIRLSWSLQSMFVIASIAALTLIL